MNSLNNIIKRKNKRIKFLYILSLVLLLVNVFQFIEINKLPKTKEVEIITVVTEEVPIIMYVKAQENAWERDIPLDKDIQKFAWELSEENDIAYDMILAVMYAESRFDESATNNNTNGTTDKGLMQLNSGYHEWQAELAGIDYNEFDPYNPYHNITAGIAVLVYYRDYWVAQGITSQEELFKYTLNSYNMGIGGFRTYARTTGSISRSYNRNILDYKIQLETEGMI